MRAVLACFAAVCLLFFSCTRERATSVAVENGPSFTLEGSGRLASFTVYGPQNGQSIAFPHSDVSVTVWRIEASSGFFEGIPVKGFHIVYGRVPEGYRQVIPAPTQGAPGLNPGIVYSFFAESTNAPVADGYFYLNGSEPIQTTIPDLCIMLSNGHEIRVNCVTKRPYEEPANLLEVVRKNEITVSTQKK
jgi:hypothetical protein